jgi:F-type H+/Na+-transporting ATPase subunit alpha
MKGVAGRLRLDLAQYRDLAAFAMFASDLDKATQSMLARGQRLVEILKQKQFSPLPVEKQIAILFAATNGYLDAFPVAEARRYEEELYTFLETRHPEMLKQIAEKKDLKGELTDKLKAVLQEFADVFQPASPPAEAAPAKPASPPPAARE